MPSITQSRLASHLRLHQSTVSLCFTAPERVKPATRKRVISAARKLGYRPHQGARATVRGKFGQIGLLTRRHIGDFQVALNRGVCEQAAEHDCHVVYAEIEFERLTDPDYAPKVLSELCVDGLLVHYGWSIPPTVIDQLQQFGLPIVWINTFAAHNCAYPDDEAGAAQATRQLATEGRQNIVYVREFRREDVYLREFRREERPSGLPPHYSLSARERGYKRAMEKLGLPVRVVDPPAIDLMQSDETIDVWRRWLKEQSPTDALLCYGHNEAQCALVASVGLYGSAADRPTVCCFHHRTVEGPFGMQPRVMPIPMVETGKAATDLLLSICNSDSRQVASQAVPFRRGLPPLPSFSETQI